MLALAWQMNHSEGCLDWTWQGAVCLLVCNGAAPAGSTERSCLSPKVIVAPGTLPLAFLELGSSVQHAFSESKTKWIANQEWKVGGKKNKKKNTKEKKRYLHNRVVHFRQFKFIVHATSKQTFAINFFLVGREVFLFFLNSYTLVKSLKQAELCKNPQRLLWQGSSMTTPMCVKGKGSAPGACPSSCTFIFLPHGPVSSPASPYSATSAMEIRGKGHA